MGAYDTHSINPKTGESYKDAVVAWNTDLKQYGSKSQEGFDFMHNSDQYYFVAKDTIFIEELIIYFNAGRGMYAGN